VSWRWQSVSAPPCQGECFLCILEWEESVAAARDSFPTRVDWWRLGGVVVCVASSAATGYVLWLCGRVGGVW
jgi:hypothetical protein